MYRPQNSEQCGRLLAQKSTDVGNSVRKQVGSTAQLFKHGFRISSPHVASVFTLREWAHVLGRYGAIHQVWSGQEQTASRFEASRDVLHQLSVIHYVFDHLAEYRDVEFLFHFFHTSQVSDVDGLEFRKAGLADSCSFSCDIQISLAPAYTCRCVASKSCSDGEGATTASDIYELLSVSCLRKKRSNPPPPVQNQSLPMYEGGRKTDQPYEKRLIHRPFFSGTRPAAA